MAVTTEQPKGLGGGEWMPIPMGLSGCPIGLEYLSTLDQIIVKQKKELGEVLLGCEFSNKYEVKNSLGQQFYFVLEETNTCMRLCCGPGRGFELSVADNNKREVMLIRREFKCCAGCCWCANSDVCSFEVIVEAPRGNIIGYARQEQSKWKPRISIRNDRHEMIGMVMGSCCPCSCCCNDVDFPVVGVDLTTEIGKITKQYKGCLRETFTDADTFSITFPQDMDVKAKAAFMGALFLVDFMLFENNQNNS